MPSDGDDDLAAGEFSAWLTAMQAALRGERDADVPCDGCTACCTSSQFVHIEPDETDTLAHIPRPAPVPGSPAARGATCCSATTSTGAARCWSTAGARSTSTGPGRAAPTTAGCSRRRGWTADQPAVARRAQRWRFAHPSPTDREQHEAVRAAAVVLRERHPEAPAARIAVGAVEGHEGIRCPR